MAFRIKRKERVCSAVRRIVRGQLRAAIRAARDEAGPQEERVHEVRTHLKRARAALRLARPDGGRALGRDEHRLREVAKRLARPRDLAVQAHTFRVLGTRLPAQVPEDLVHQLARVERQIRRDLTADEVERELRRSARALAKARRRVGHWKGEGGRRAIADGVTRTYRKARRAMRAASAQPNAERFHDWRKQVKRLSYQLRIVRGAIPELATTLVPKVEKLAELLGQMHDLDCAKATIDLHPRWLGRPSDRQAVLTLLDERRTELERETLALAEAVFAGRARDVRELVEIGWSVWRRQGRSGRQGWGLFGGAPFGADARGRGNGAVKAA